jgi:hypothetical protein
MVKKVHHGAVKVNPEKRRVNQDPGKLSLEQQIL